MTGTLEENVTSFLGTFPNKRQQGTLSWKLFVSAFIRK